MLARAPADAGPRVERVTQRVPAVVGDRNCAPDGLRAMLPSEVSELAAPGAIWPDDGRIHPGIGIEEWECGGEDIRFFHLAVQAGSLAVGLPPTTHGERLRCTADGQARAVLALWLGAQAVPDGQRRLDTLATDEYLAGFAHLDFWGAGEQIDRSSPWEVPPQWGTRFLHSDLDAARRLHALPVDEVARLVSGNWDTLTAPSTPTAEFLTMAGLSAQESVDGGVPAPGIGRCP